MLRRRPLLTAAGLLTILATTMVASPCTAGESRIRKNEVQSQPGLLIPIVLKTSEKEPEAYYTITFSDVLVSSYQVSGSAGGSTEPVVTIEYLVLGVVHSEPVELVGADELGIYVEDEAGRLLYILLM